MNAKLTPSVPPLRTYYIYLTGSCNMKCGHCGIDAKYYANDSICDFIDLSIIRQAIVEGIPLGLRTVKLSGGEPLLHPQCNEIVKIVNQFGRKIAIETNGVLLNQHIVDSLSASKIFFISVSLDGCNASTHDSLRGVKGCYDNAVRGIVLLVKAGIRPQVIFSVHRSNMSEIEETAHLAERLGCSSMKINLIHRIGRAKKNNSVEMLEFDDFYRLGIEVTSTIRKRVSMPVIYSWPLAFQPIDQLCHAGVSCNITTLLGIMPDGRMTICSYGEKYNSSGIFDYGMIGIDKVSDIWCEHPVLLKLRESIPENLTGICRQCIFRVPCKGFCPVDNYIKDGELTTPFWFCDEAANKGLFPKTRIIQ